MRTQLKTTTLNDVSITIHSHLSKCDLKYHYMTLFKQHDWLKVMWL